MLRELPGAWRVAYLFFALAYMLILGTGQLQGGPEEVVESLGGSMN